MNEDIVKKIISRWEMLIANASPREMGLGMTGSMNLFRSSLSLIGYPFKNPLEWMDEEYCKPAMTREEFDSDTYDELINALYELAYDKINLINQKNPEDFNSIKNNKQLSQVKFFMIIFKQMD